jgi:hypothetical protein
MCDEGCVSRALCRNPKPSRLRVAPEACAERHVMEAGADPAEPFATHAPRAFWVYARQVDRVRHGRAGATTVPLGSVYPRFVREECARAGLMEDGLGVNDQLPQWVEHHRPFADKVVGLIACRPASMSSLMLYLGRQQRAVQDFWQLTQFNSSPVMFLEILAACSLETPRTAHAGGLNNTPKGIFSTLTRFSAQTCWDTPVLNSGERVHDVIARWSARFPLQPESSVQVAISMPVPHALLTVRGAWQYWGFPLAVGRSAGGLGLPLIREWTRGVGRVAPLRAGDWDGPAVSIDLLQGLADVMRRQAMGVVDPDELRHYVNFVQGWRDEMLRVRFGLSRRIFAMSHMVSCMLVAGLLRTGESLRTVLTDALRVAVKEQPVLDHYLGLIQRAEAVPRRSTLYRHRLTIHQAVCNCARREAGEQLAAGDVIRWGTMDSSPQGKHNWLMAGFATMSVSDIEDSVRLAHRLWQLREADDAEELAEAAAAMTSLSSRLELTPGVPTAVGHGRASLADKVHCLAHSCRLTSPTWRDCAKLLSSTVSWTGDLGTEAGVAGASTSLLALFGPWVAEQDASAEAADSVTAEAEAQAANDGFDFQAEGKVPLAEAARPADPYRVSWRHSLFVPGVLHIMHNCTEDFSNSMPGWDGFIVQLRNVARMLHKPQRLLATCFSRPPHAAKAHRFQSFPHTVYEGRWGDALRTTRDLLSLMADLRSAWDLRLYNFGRDDVQDNGRQDDKHGVKLTIVDEAIRSSYFWGYCSVVDIVGDALLQCMAWAEGCACHPGDEHRTYFRRSRNFQHKYKVEFQGCPMRTRRAPEMASDGLVKHLRRVFSQGSEALLLLPPVAELSPNERAKLLREYGRARQHLAMTFSIKLAHWRQLPWILAGIAHPDRDIAKSCGERALQLYPSAPPDVRRHPAVRALCDPASPASQELSHFVYSSGRIDQLPALQLWLGKFLFMPIAERWVESLHAVAKHQLMQAPHYSVVHLAWRGVQTRLRAMIARRPEAIVEFAESCLRVNNARKALVEAGFWLHPGVQQKTRDERSVRGLNRHLRRWATDLLYHADADTLYKDFGGLGGESASCGRSEGGRECVQGPGAGQSGCGWMLAAVG